MWYVYKVRDVKRVVDGDTVDLEIDLGFYQYGIYRFRLWGIDTPELRGGTDETKEAARAARDFVQEWLEDYLTTDREVLIATEKADSFGRWLGSIYTVIDDVVLRLNDELVEKGHAVRKEY